MAQYLWVFGKFAQSDSVNQCGIFQSHFGLWKRQLIAFVEVDVSLGPYLIYDDYRFI